MSTNDKVAMASALGCVEAAVAELDGVGYCARHIPTIFSRKVESGRKLLDAAYWMIMEQRVSKAVLEENIEDAQDLAAVKAVLENVKRRGTIAWEAALEELGLQTIARGPADDHA